MDNMDAIHSALERLALRPNSDAFLVVEESRAKKFVQFAKDSANNLIFDLPGQTLTSEEFTRALDVLKPYGITLDEWEVFDKPGGKVVDTQKGFTKNLGKDIEVVTEIAYAVFTKIYLFVEPIQLSISEN